MMDVEAIVRGSIRSVTHTQ